MTLNQFQTKYKITERCCFSGHRIIASDELFSLKDRLTAELENLINRGVVVFIAGGALGFDTLAAQTVLKLKGKYPFVKLVLALPCKEQDARWKDKDKEVYEDILRRADLVHYVNESYTPSCMRSRNDYMVEWAEYCMCYLRYDNGGTYYTVSRAKRLGRELIRL